MKKTIGILIIITLLSCDSKNEAQDSRTFDVAPMLKNWADNIIIPRYQEFITKVELLDVAVGVFTKTPSALTLKTTREAYRVAYLEFQKVSMFEVGTTMETKYRSYINTYPVNKDKLIQKIEAKDTNLTSEDTRDKQGFPAIDYLLNGLADTDEAIAQVYLGTNKDAYQEYLKLLTSRIKTLSEEVLKYWKNGYRDTFVQNTKDDVTGSVNMMGNAFIQYFEKYIRAAKIAIPLGLLSNGALPDRVEARYDTTLPKALLKQSLQSFKEFFNGKNGTSFKQYLDVLKTNKKDDNTLLLSDAINARFDEAATAIEALDDNFVSQISTDKDKLQKVYDALQYNVILLKIDMTQALNIVIDYRDSDGD